MKQRILFVSVDPSKVDSVTYDGEPMEKIGDGGYRKDSTVVEMCEWVPCKEEGKYLEASGDGRLVRVCTPHRRLLTKQKRIYEKSGN